MSVELPSRLSYCHAQKRPNLPPIQKSGSYPTCGGESDCGVTWSECGGIGIRRKLPLTEQYRRRKYEMPASHSAVRRTLAGRGEPRTPAARCRAQWRLRIVQSDRKHQCRRVPTKTKRKQRRLKYAKKKQNDHYPLYRRRV